MLVCILLLLVGCTESSVSDISIKDTENFYATIDNADSRTYIDEQIRLRWNANDCITLFRKNTYNREYIFTGTTGANAGGFRQKSADDEFWYGADVPYNYAVYPHSANTQLDETEHFLTLTMPDKQTYVENSFGPNANTMVAVSNSGQLNFKNVCSYLRVRLYGKSTKISSIMLVSKGDEAIAGTAKVTPAINGNPTCEMIGTGKSIRLSCPTPVAISSDANSPTDFWIAVPPVTLAKGFYVTIENKYGDIQVFDVDNSVSFVRNQYNNLKREVNFKTNIPNNQIWYTSEDNNKIYIDRTDEDMFIDAKIISNEMKDGIGVITFDKEVTTVINLPAGFVANVKSLYMPNSITKFSAMHSAAKLVAVQFSSNLKELGGFSGCNRLKTVTLPNRLTGLDSAFSFCKNLEYVTIPSSLTNMDTNNHQSVDSFQGCEAIKEIHCKATNPPINALFHSTVYAACKLYVPKGSLGKYKAADGWSNFVNISEED